VPGRYLVGAAAVLSVVVGAFLTLPGRSWMPLALARGGVPFGETDPYMEADLGFFVYWLPFERALYTWALITVLVTTVLVCVLYALTPSLRWEHGSLYVSQYVRRHLVALGAVMLLLLAWSYRLDAYGVIISGSGPDGAFTFSDHRAAIPVSIWLAILAVAVACTVLFFGWAAQFRVAFAALTALLLVAFAARQLGPVLARRLASTADADVRELPYRQIRADYTRRAYALDRVGRGSSVAFAAPRDAIGAIAVWDPLVLERSVTRLQRADVVARGVGWAPASIGLEAFVVEGPAQDDRAQRTPARWSVQRVSASAVDARGAPVSLDPIANDGERDAEALPPVLVYDSVPGYAVVPDPRGQIAAPALSSGFSRLAHAWSLQNFDLLSGNLARDARIITRRGVRERVRAIAPFFAQGGTVLPVVAADSLYWVVDLYAASASYPLSEHVLLGSHEYSYVRYAAAAVVNAHTGRVSLVADPAAGDPIVASWTREFPALFATGASLPPAVIASLPPAVDGARIQAVALARYGVRGEAPPLGHLPWNEGADSLLRATTPAVFQLPRGDLAWSQPVLDSTDHLMGLVVGTRRSGGLAETHWFPLKEPGARWNALVDQLRRAVDSTATVPSDARLAHGLVRAIPVSSGIGLLQPAYVWRPDSVPTLARLGMVRDTVVTTGATLAQALGVVAPPLATDTSAAAQRGFRARVSELYQEMRDALQHGDWQAFGRAYEALGRLVAPGRP